MKTKALRLRRLGLLLGPLLVVFAGCAEGDEKEARPTRDSFGAEIFGVLCDRVGAQSLHEDLTGASYQTICHGSAEKVDTARLPPAADARTRELAIAKVEALARHRVDLVAALDAVFPDDNVVGKNLTSKNPADSCDPRSSTPRREQLRSLLTRLLPTTSDTVPESSRALARSVEPLTVAEGQAARAAIARLAARRNYMQADYATGLLGSVFTAPRLRDMLGATMHLFSPDASPYDKPGTMGTGHDELQQFIVALKEDLAEPLAENPLLSVSRDADTGRTILSRPRTTLELMREVLLTENPAFSNGNPLFVVRRDARGLAAITRTNGKLAAPFVDANNDGLPDVDRLGRFVLKDGKAPTDPFVNDDRNVAAYQYIDARATAASALLRHVAPLADPDGGKEALLAAAEGLSPLVREGGREALLDLVHAAAQATADPGTDEALALVGRMFTEKPQLMARLTGNLLDAKATLDAHPEAAIPDGSSFVDDLVGVLVKIGREPFLLEEVLGSMGDDRSAFLAKALPPLMAFRDRLSYDPNALNAMPVNLDTHNGAPETLVDRSAPSTGFNRSLLQRFLQLIHDTSGVTVCNKEGAILHSNVNLPNPDGSPNWVHVPFPFGGGATECQLLRIEDLSKFYLRSIVGAATIHFRNDALTPSLEPEVLFRSIGIKGTWDTPKGEDLRPRPEFLNRLVFFDVAKDSPNPGDPFATTPPVFASPNGMTNFAISELQGAHIPSSACTERSIADPNIGDPDVHPDGMIHGLRTCTDGQNLDQRNRDTIFALEYNHGYEAITPLTSVFIKHQKEDLLLELLEVLHKHWSIEGGIVRAEPALAEIFASDLIPSVGEITKYLRPLTVTRCVDPSCTTPQKVPAAVVLADGIRTFMDPARATAGGVTDRRGSNKTADGKPITLFGMFRDALRAEDAALARYPGKQNQYLAARSRIVDEFLTVNGRGAEATFADPGIAPMVPTIVELLRAQRIAKCAGDAACPAIRKGLATDIEETLKSNIFGKSLDLFDVVLKDPPTRRELGRMTAYMTRQDVALGGADVSPASTPFATTKARSPGALDQSIAALVDALGALGDLKDVRPFYPILSRALDHLDPQLALLSRLNARAYDNAGHEICSKELDPEETIRNTLSRLSLIVKVDGQPKRSALTIFLEAMSDVNRFDAAKTGPLEPDDYGNVFKNVHELLTDPKSGLEQLYASVKSATEK